LVTECRGLGVQTELLQGDLSLPDTLQDFIKRYLEKYSDTRVIVNNVGHFIAKTGLETSTDEWLDLFQTNVLAPFSLIQSLLPSLKKHKGNVVNIGTVAVESQSADTFATAYKISKQGLLLLTKCLAKELLPFGVRVNMVSPGILEHSIAIPKQPLHLLNGRFGNVEEVAEAVTFLIDEKNSYITGQNFDVAGGFAL